ncbi:methyltransferase domain-containing protein [Streptomyces sp. ODS28]|uniref:class I SAM-dependent methyltransferase n=1 Tax=Streptomyces sp. ODS28 TaxID=3136688 RepID=UPI0031E881DE
MGRELRVLDTSLGRDRADRAIRFAREGHRVTALESDPDLLELARESVDAEPKEIRRRIRVVPGGSEATGAHFLPGSFDLVLSHGDLMEAQDPSNTLAGLARVLDAGGLLSLLVRNDDALALIPARAGDWDATLAALGFTERTFRLDDLASLLSRLGVPLRQWYGVQVFSGSAPQEARAAGDDRDERLQEAEMEAELQAGRTDPYRAVAPMLHLCASRQAAAAAS